MLDQNCVLAGNIIDSAFSEVSKWLQQFQGQTNATVLGDAFTAGGYLANMAWMADGTTEYSFTVKSDLGRDVGKPYISRAGVIVVSILLALDLLALFALALYASLSPRWTGLLDAFAMIRLGLSLGERVPLMVVEDSEDVTVMDRIPGFLGDISEPQSEVGQVGLGGRVPLRRKRLYQSYPRQQGGRSWTRR